MEQRKKRIEPEMAAEEEEREKKQTAKEQKGGRLGIISATTRENESTRGDQKRTIRIRIRTGKQQEQTQTTVSQKNGRDKLQECGIKAQAASAVSPELATLGLGLGTKDNHGSRGKYDSLLAYRDCTIAACGSCALRSLGANLDIASS